MLFRSLGAELPGARLLWTRDDAIFHSPLARWAPRRITPPDKRERRPRWSPDGRWIVFERDGEGVFIMREDFSAVRRILPNAHTADWANNGRAVTAIADDGYRVLRYVLASGVTSVLHDTREPPYHGQVLSQIAELHPGGRYLLTFRRTPEHATEIIDLEARRYIADAEMRRGDCDAAWTPDGTGVLTTARTTDRPVFETSFDPRTGALGKRTRLAGMESWSRYYAHNGRLSRDGQWLVFAGKVLIGTGMLGRHEIYVWRRGDTDQNIVRLTFNTNEDILPSLYIPAR